MFNITAIIMLVVSLGLASGQETGLGIGTCTYSFVVQSPYCGKDVGTGAEADIQRLQDSAEKLKTELAKETSALKSEIDELRRENDVMKTAISLIRSRQVATVGEIVTATPLPATVIEGRLYVFTGCPGGIVNEIVHFVHVNITGFNNGIRMLSELTLPPFPIFCSVGQYIVVQRRTFPFHLSFNRTWDEYKNGFGDMNGEFWLGLEKLYQITNQQFMTYLVRIETRSKSGKLWFDEYNDFTIGDEKEQYEVKSTGSAGSRNVNTYFSLGGKFFTHDQDTSNTCGFQNNGFWYSNEGSGSYKCSYVLLNAIVPMVYRCDGEQISTEIKIRQ